MLKTVDGIEGGKTGYTVDAGSTLVTYAKKDGMTLVCVVMKVKSPGQYLDTRNLFMGCSQLESVDLYNFRFNNVTDMCIATVLND